MARGFSSLRRARGRSGAVALVVLGLCACWGGLHQPSSAFAAKKAEAVEEVEPPKESTADHIASIVAANALAVAAAVMVVSSLVSRQEPPPPPVATVVPVEKRSDLTRLGLLAVLLSGVSGMVNAVAIIQMGGTVAHHTGNASHTGRLAGTDGARFLVLMVAYFFGAAVTGYRKSSGEQALIGKASPALFGSALAVAGGGLIHWASGNSLIALPVLAFSQGIHNGVTSKFSSMPLRTTHMTGTLTDTGALCGAWLRSQLYGDAAPPMNKTVFLLSTLFAFGAGGVLAKMCTDSIGSLAVLPPAAVLAVMAMGVLPLGEAPAETVKKA